MLRHVEKKEQLPADRGGRRRHGRGRALLWPTCKPGLHQASSQPDAEAHAAVVQSLQAPPQSCKRSAVSGLQHTRRLHCQTNKLSCDVRSGYVANGKGESCMCKESGLVNEVSEKQDLHVIHGGSGV